MSKEKNSLQIQIENNKSYEKFDDFIKSQNFKNLIRNVLNEFRIFNKRKIEKAIILFLERNKNGNDTKNIQSNNYYNTLLDFFEILLNSGALINFFDNDDLKKIELEKEDDLSKKEKVEKFINYLINKIKTHRLEEAIEGVKSGVNQSISNEELFEGPKFIIIKDEDGNYRIYNKETKKFYKTIFKLYQKEEEVRRRLRIRDDMFFDNNTIIPTSNGDYLVQVYNGDHMSLLSIKTGRLIYSGNEVFRFNKIRAINLNELETIIHFTLYNQKSSKVNNSLIIETGKLGNEWKEPSYEEILGSIRRIISEDSHGDKEGDGSEDLEGGIDNEQPWSLIEDENPQRQDGDTTNTEPSMEKIYASIRRIVAEG